MGSYAAAKAQIPQLARLCRDNEKMLSQLLNSRA
ncbi:unnamed protein product [Mycetohabitans rhizoxinica HKI 454]|uniref:Uncharacterized protein n=1 Tax=Mycetohabitans rhizoxinica (strain DSM 19002 / CIP 109453 / HKI 454) TaxID=882378 RepID=E5ASP7_MYCRK|nr:unnamed protein product [Mycetohabitans rhizoxinica HKI 454]